MKLVFKKYFYLLNFEDFLLILLLLLLEIGLFSYRADIYDTVRRKFKQSSELQSTVCTPGIKAKQYILLKWRWTWDLTSTLCLSSQKYSPARWIWLKVVSIDKGFLLYSKGAEVLKNPPALHPVTGLKVRAASCTVIRNLIIPMAQRRFTAPWG